MKVLVLGATGMAGHTITIYLQDAGHNVTAFSRKKFDYCKKYVIGDASDFICLKEVILKGNYDVIVNAVGILNEYAEKDKAEAVILNSYLPHYISEIVKGKKIKLIHISTDCVFSGKEGHYKETSFRDGYSFYARSKALGELENDKDLTFRTSIIGPDMKKKGIGLLNWFMKQEDRIRGYKEVIWKGVTTTVLAKAIEQAMRENITGIYHLVNNYLITKYDLLILLNKYMKNDELEVIPDNYFKSNKSLINNRIDFSFKVPDYETMIAEMRMWIHENKELYPHYCFEG